ncbi:MAG TPA: MBL fold metallo-hydrolase [Chitinophagaceae bacterium]|nr:MBL fold metallo-hydrolase [Chitinophagaceae bacterium]
MHLKPAVIKDEALLKEIEQYTHDEKNFHLWWLGQSGYLLLWKGKKILLDPYLSDSLTKKYADTNKPHVRISERVIAPELLKGISIVTSSHNHTDHLDAETLIPLIKNNPGITFIIPEANRKFVAERIKCDIDFPSGLTDGQSVSEGDFVFYGIPAKHNEIERDSRGNCKFMGYVIRFGKWAIYHSGDTLWFDEMEDLLKPYNINVALLPVNGDDPARGVAGNLNGKEAAVLGKTINAGMIIPCHYDMFVFNTADPAYFAQEAEQLQQPYTILQQGGHFSSEQLN